ncbi:DDB1- and CUL4-associated factor 8 [Vitis vinifera]|uniref:DDB1-and CUL4-associated factor 8 n=1 Tax=Vitis vinifera TaxID=29760 RepID=A0A438IIN3_VITVI|nr:DDB1- and CUL4-associated factor 8 [Vitis vinifera]
MPLQKVFYGSMDLVLQFDIYRKLEKHRGCVNTVSFNADGDILVSGSDDRRIILWDWESGHVKLSFESGHINNVFQAKFMPYTDDRSIVTCAADGQVRRAQILECGRVETTLLAKHQGRAHKLAIEPGSPYIFYTCGEDGLVQHIDLRSRAATELLTCHQIEERRRGLRAVVQLNAIAIDPRNSNLFAVAGSDEYARLYDIRKYKWDGSTDFDQPIDFFCPSHLIGNPYVGITGLSFSDQRELLVSYNDEFIYLFTKDIGLGPDPIPASPASLGSGADHPLEASTMDTDENVSPKSTRGTKITVAAYSFGKKSGELIRVMEADQHVVNCIESHPHATVLASSGIEKDIKIWTPKATEKAILPKTIERVYVGSRGNSNFSAVTCLEKVMTPARFHRYFAVDDDNNYFYGDDDDDDDDDNDDDDDDDDDDDADDEDDDDDDANGDDDDDDYNDNIDDDDGGGGGGIDDKPKAMDRMYRLASPQDLMIQLFSLQRQLRTTREEHGAASLAENLVGDQELFDLIMTFNANSDVSSDDGDTSSSAEDPCS